jgi:hypothetical protein
MSRVQSSLLAYGSTPVSRMRAQVSATRIVGKRNRRSGASDLRGIGEATRSRLLTYWCDCDPVALAGDFSNRSRRASAAR